MAAQKLFFTADPHLDWRGVLSNGWAKRPPTTTTEHRRWLANKINDHVTASDRIVMLGDLSYGKNAVEQAASLHAFLATLTCKNIVFIRGNHDNVNAIQCLGMTPYDYLMIKWQGHEFFCCHYPMLTWQNSHHGSICCYGHTHAAYEDEFDRLMPQRRSLDVGLENSIRLLGEYRPFEAEEIVHLLQHRSGSFPIASAQQPTRAVICPTQLS